MTKSVINALLGISDAAGPHLAVDCRRRFRNGAAATDPRREIEVEHLMRMTTGLALDETNTGFDPSSQMLYLHNDMAGFAVKAPTDRPAGNAMGLQQRHHAAIGANHPRHHRRPRADAGVRVARAVQSARDAPGNAAIRRRRHAAGIVQHAGERQGLGDASDCFTSMMARSAASACCTRTGWIFRPPPRSTPTMAPGSGPIAASTEMPGAASRMGDSARRVLCVRRSWPARS